MDYINIPLNNDIINILKKTKDFSLKWWKIVVFYIEKNCNIIDRNLIINLIYILEKKSKYDINYYFYNVPFCIFKEFWEQYIDNHCIFNRLCNYYEWYTDLWKCTKCKYWLFCNNFYSWINSNITDKLEWFYRNTIKKEYLLWKITQMSKFFTKLWYKESEVVFASRQKYMHEFVFSNAEISEHFIDYLTLDINLTNNNISKKLFVDIRWSTYVFKNKNLDEEFFEISKNIWINFNVRWKRYLKYKSFITNHKWIDFYFLEKNAEYFRYTPKFFDFNLDTNKNKTVNIFKWISKFQNKQTIQSNNTIVVKKAHDFLDKKWKIYIWKDIFSGINIENFDAILLTCDASSMHNRIDNVDLSNTDIWIITDITPDITQYLNDWDELIIDFNNWTITRC